MTTDLVAAAEAVLRFRPGNQEDGWLQFEGADEEWDEMKSAAFQQLAHALRRKYGFWAESFRMRGFWICAGFLGGIVASFVIAGLQGGRLF